MLALRSSLLLCTLIITFFIAVTQSLQVDGRVEVKYLGTPNQKRAAKEHNPPPCEPSGATPKPITVKDDGAKVGILPYTAAMVQAANAQLEAKAAQPKFKLRSLFDAPLTKIKQWSARGLTQREFGSSRIQYNKAQVKVPTDGGAYLKYNMHAKNIEDQIIATKDLSGCTVLVIGSPFVIIMIHVWERRAEKGSKWMLENEGSDQMDQDLEFVKKGQELLETILVGFGGNLNKGFGGYLPLDKTSIHIVAPAYNPDKKAEGNPKYTAPGSEKNPQGLFYPQATETLMMAAKAMVLPGAGDDQAKILTYRRRYSDDVLHGTDDREFITIYPVILANKEVWATMVYDDDKYLGIAKLG